MALEGVEIRGNPAVLVTSHEPVNGGGSARVFKTDMIGADNPQDVPRAPSRGLLS